MIITADRLTTDGSAHAFLLNVPTDVPILLVSRVGDYRFNQDILSLKGKKYVLIDFLEYGWDWKFEFGHTWGVNTDKVDFLKGDEYAKLDDFIRENPPALTLKRELLLEDVTDNVKPIEYPNYQPSYPVQSKDLFDNRLINVFYYWGRSNENRVRLHSEIWANSSKNGASICDNIYYFNQFMAEEKSNNRWITLNIPHYGRIDILNLLAINGSAKLSVSMAGAGIKCFRSTGESIVNSVAVMMEDKLAWAYPFIHLENCIKFTKYGEEIATIEEALRYDNLYEVYRNGLATAEKYQINNYINNYILPLINKA